jgi:cytochrome c oxidase assembly factor 5
MRKRFRGNAPISVSRELEGGKSQTPDQLYAGKPAFSSVKETSGNEAEMDPDKTRGL